jgi:hypothetical protein
MKVKYICHACLSIESGDLQIVTDPWFDGPAFCKQWNVFPRPVDTDVLQNADVILISHGHEDHLHEPSLRRLPKRASVFYPYSFFGGTKEYLQEMGFQNVREAMAYKTYKLAENTLVTYIPNAHDNIMVIEAGGQVIVNANDALHAYPESVIDSYIRSLLNSWPQIDILFCGFGGANYFPNTLHVKGKDDLEIGKIREQLFAHNFCRVVAGLRPRVAVPFAADFALLSPEQRWINEVRFPRASFKNYYRKHFKSAEYEPEIYDMYPGDVLDDCELRTKSPYRRQLQQRGLNRLIDEQYATEIAALKEPHLISEAESAAFVDEIREHLEYRSRILETETLPRLKFCLRVPDIAGDNCLNIGFRGGKAGIQRSSAPASDCFLVMDISSSILRHSISTEWGGEAIKIGYGCEIQLLDRRAAEVNLDTVCVQLLTSYPTPVSYMKSHPLRAAKYVVRNLNHMIRNPLLRNWVLRRLKLSGKEVENYDRNIWLLRSGQEIRQMYNLPELDREFESQA